MKPVVDLNTNTISLGDEAVQLTAGQAEFLAVLSMAAPEIMAFERLIAGIWGAKEGPDDPQAVLRVQACRLRPKLAPLGLTIVSSHGKGVALRPLDSTTGE